MVSCGLADSVREAQQMLLVHFTDEKTESHTVWSCIWCLLGLGPNLAIASSPQWLTVTFSSLPFSADFPLSLPLSHPLPFSPPSLLSSVPSLNLFLSTLSSTPLFQQGFQVGPWTTQNYRANFTINPVTLTRTYTSFNGNPFASLWLIFSIYEVRMPCG